MIKRIGIITVLALLCITNYAHGSSYTSLTPKNASTIFKVPNSTTLPATCATGQTYMDTDATSGKRFYLCESADTWKLQGDGTAAAGAPITLDLGNDGDDSVDLNKISTTGDTNSVFTEPAADELRINVGNNWPTCDLADAATALAADPANCVSATEFAVGVTAAGVASCEAIADADVPNTITIDLAATATAAASQVITDNAICTVDDADAADNDYAKFTAAGIEGRSYAEVKTDLSLNNVENTALSTGNAGTATALAANGANCVVSTQFAVGVDADGAAECEAIADADVPNDITIDLSTLATTLTTNDDESTNTAFEILFSGAPGISTVKSDSGFTYNPSTGTVKATLLEVPTGSSAGLKFTTNEGVIYENTSTKDIVIQPDLTSAYVYISGPGIKTPGVKSTGASTELILQQQTINAGIAPVKILPTFESTSGSQGILEILPTYNQASGDAANTDLLINRTETNVGSGAQLLIDAQTDSVSMFNVDNSGNVDIPTGSEYRVNGVALSGGAETNSLETIVTGIADDEIPIGSAADDSVYTAIPDCNAVGSALAYEDSTNTISCRSGFAAGSGMNNFVLEDADGTEVTVEDAEEIKFIDSTGLTINWTDTSTGSDADPFDLTFTIEATLADISDGTIAENLVNTDNPWADNEVADNISITNISQVGDISATASEINTPLDGASVTLTEFQELETIGATVIEAGDWTAVAAMSGVNSGDQNLFETIATTSGTNPVADSTTDTLTLTAGSGITITGDSGTDTVTIAATGGAEVNNLETVTTGILTTEIPIGQVAGDAVYHALSGGVTMTEGGVVTVVTNANLTGEVTSVGNAAVIVESFLQENGASELVGESLGTACAENQILKANATGGLDCAADAGGTPTDDGGPDATWDSDTTEIPSKDDLHDYLSTFDADYDADLTDESWYPTGIEITHIPQDTYMGAIVDTTEGNFTAGEIFISNNDTVFYSPDGANFVPIKTFVTETETSDIGDTGDVYVNYGSDPARSYYCATGHTSAAGNAPGTAGGDAYWEETTYNDGYSDWAGATDYDPRDVSLVRIKYHEGFLYASPMCESCDDDVSGMWRTNNIEGSGWVRVRSLPTQVAMYNIAEFTTGADSGDMYMTPYSLWTIDYARIFISTNDGTSWTVAYTPPDTIVSYSAKYWISRDDSNIGNTPSESAYWTEDPNGADATGVSAYSAGTTYNVGRRHMHDLVLSPDGSTMFAVVADPMQGAGTSPHQLPANDCSGHYEFKDGELMLVKLGTADNGSWSSYEVQDKSGYTSAGVTCNTNYVGIHAISNEDVIGTLEATGTAYITLLDNGVMSELYTQELPDVASHSYAFYVQESSSANIYIPGRGNGGMLQVTDDDGTTWKRAIDLSNPAWQVTMNNISPFVSDKAIIGYQLSGADGGSADGLYSPEVKYPAGLLIEEKKADDMLLTSMFQPQISEMNILLTDDTYNNVSVERHGLVPKLPNDDTKFLDGTGEWVANSGSVAGSDGHVQYNNGGSSFGGEANFVYDDTNKAVQIITEAATSPRGLEIWQHNDGTHGPGFAAYKSRGSSASPTSVVDGDYLALYNFRGYESAGAAYDVAARIGVIVDGATASGIVPTEMVFYTQDSSGGFNDNLHIFADQSIRIAGYSGSYQHSLAHVYVDNDGDFTVSNAAVKSNATLAFAGTAGEAGVDTTSGQFKYHDGTSGHVITEKDCKSAVIENLAAADDNFSLGMFNYGVTITDIGLHCAGTCTTGADISLEDRAGNAMTHTVPTHSTGTGSTTFQSVTAANTLTAGEGLQFDVDNAVSPETDTYTITYCFTVTAD